MDDKKLAGRDMGRFVVYPAWSKENGSVVVSLSLSHKDGGGSGQPLQADAVRASLYGKDGEEWPCLESPQGALVAITGPGMTSVARFVFAPPAPGSTPQRIKVSVFDAEESFSLD